MTLWDCQETWSLLWSLKLTLLKPFAYNGTEHGRILQALPDAVRDKIGFRGTGQ